MTSSEDEPTRIEWPDWLGRTYGAALRDLEQTAVLAAAPCQPDRVRAAGRRVRVSLSALKRTAVQGPATTPWPRTISPDAVEALELIESCAARGAVETFAAPRPWGGVRSAMRQLRQDLTELDAALVADEMIEELLEVAS